MWGLFPTTTRCSPLVEKVMARTAAMWGMVACRVSCESHILIVRPAAVVATPKMEFGLSWDGEIATAFTSSLWGVSFGGA